MSLRHRSSSTLIHSPFLLSVWIWRNPPLPKDNHGVIIVEMLQTKVLFWRHCRIKHVPKDQQCRTLLYRACGAYHNHLRFMYTRSCCTRDPIIDIIYYSNLNLLRPKAVLFFGMFSKKKKPFSNVTHISSFVLSLWWWGVLLFCF